MLYVLNMITRNKNRLVELFPIKYIAPDGTETCYHNALAATDGNYNEAFKVAHHARMHIVEPDGGKWDWCSIDKERLQRILEITTELEEEQALLRYLFGRNGMYCKTFKELPEDVTDLLYFDATWRKNRFWKPRIDALKKTYYRPIQMLDAETGEVLGEWDSARQCCAETGMRKGDISLILSGKRRLKSIHGKTFRYKFKKDRERASKELRQWKKGKREQWKMKKTENSRSKPNKKYV